MGFSVGGEIRVRPLGSYEGWRLKGMFRGGIFLEDYMYK